MRTVFALILFGLATWRAVLDWNATFAQDGAWRFAETGQLFNAQFPQAFEVIETLIRGFLGEGAWGAATSALSLPLVSVLLFAGALIWMIRRPRGVARRNVFKR